MKTLLLGINAKYIHPNLAIRLLKANTTYPVDIVEFNIKDSKEKIIQYILENHYEFVGISSYIWNINLIKEILPSLKKEGIILMLGGPEVSYNANYYLENGLADYVIKNEGEEAFHLLLKYLHHKGKLIDVPNLYYAGGFTFDKLVDISKTKMAYDLLDDVENQIVYIETSRGCPYHCGYCMASLDNKLRFFDIEEIKRQVLLLIKKGAKVFKFLDRTFNANKKNFISLLDFIIANHRPLNSFQFEITGDLLDDDIITYINTHAPKDLFRFEIGIQSTNKKANLAVGRIQNNEKLFHNIKLIQDANIIDLHLDLIAGLPYEDYASFQKTFNEVLALKPKELQLGFLKLLYGTRLYKEASLYGYQFMDKAPYEIIANDFLSVEDIQRIHLCEDAFDKYYNHGYFKKTMQYLLEIEKDPYRFFYALGILKSKQKEFHLEDTTKLLDDFLREDQKSNYEILHETLILDYLNCFKIKPKPWWDERLLPKEKNELLRKSHEEGKIPEDLNTLFKYSMVIPLQKKTIIAIYRNQNMLIYTI